MNRTGLLIVLAIGTALGLVFGIYPGLDIAIAALFYDPANQRFVLLSSPLARTLRESATWVVAAMVAPAVLALVLKLVLPRWRMIISARAALLLVVTLILGPGLLANAIFKDNWGRPRPIEVTQFGGPERFVAWWDPRGTCPKNCSFVAGEGAGAFWTLAPAALAPPQWRAIAYAGAVAFGATVGVLRMAFGGHFFSDVVFAGVLMFLVVWVMHGLIYRWRTRLSDAAVEGAIERAALAFQQALHALATRLLGALRRGPRRTPGKTDT